MDSDEFVPLPDLDNQQSDDYIFGADPTLWQDDNLDNENYSVDSNDDLIPNRDPLYPNQEDDPEVQRIQFEYDQYIDGLFK